nr:microsomal triglyceride transfer protein large [Hymenolepis microstoma]
MEGPILLALLSFFINFNRSKLLTNVETHIYSYKSEIQSPGNEHLHGLIKGHVLVNSRVVGARRKPSGATGTAPRLLLYILLELEGSQTPLQGLALRDETGLVEKIYLPASYNSSNIRINFLKAVAGIFNYHHLFVPGVEYDASGKCRTFYGEVEVPGETEVMVIDKQKIACKPIGQPADAGIWSVSSIFKGISTTNSWVRYNIVKESGVLVKATTHEQHSIAIPMSDDATGGNDMKVNSVQELELLKESSSERKRIMEKLQGYLKTTQSNDPTTAAAQLLDQSITIQHLALSIPPQSASVGCGIQSAAFTMEAFDSPKVNLNVNTLKELLNKFKKATEDSARVSSTHAALQLIRFLRCLSSDRASIQTLAATLELIPSTLREFNRQLESKWNNQLTDIVIDCGTELCLELLRQRIVKVTQLADLERVGSTASREVLPVRTYLINNLWPSVAHISNPSINILRELATLCFHSLPYMEKIFRAAESSSENPFNCLLATSTLVSHFKGNYVEEKLVFSKYEETLTNFITIGSKIFIDDSLNRHKLLAGFAAAEKLRIPSLSDPIISVVKNQQVPSVIRAVGLKTLGNLDFDRDSKKTDNVIALLNEFIDSSTPGPYFANEADEMVLKFGAFSVLLNLNISAPKIAKMISKFGSNKQWSLMASCRRLVDSWCEDELLSESTCRCIRYGGDMLSDSGEKCYPGLGAGWSGLSGTTSAGEVNLIRGDIFDNRPYLLSDYTLQWSTGAHGEIKTSNLAISLIDSDGEAKLLSFNIYGNQMESLMGKGDSGADPWLSVGFTLFHGSTPPTQIFSGGITEIINILFNAPSEPTPFYNAIRLPIDIRHYLPSSSGWILRNDLLGVVSVELSGALRSSLFSQSGTALVRTRAAVAVENSLNLLFQENQHIPLISSVSGAGTAARFDFLVRMEMGGMPDAICMHLQRSRLTPIMRWVGKFEDSPILSKRTSVLQPLPKSVNVTNDNYKLVQYLRVPPVSFHLGSLNAARCRKVGVTNEWD